MPILLFISVFTLLDFVVLFSVGSHIGLLTTLLLVLLTGFVGLHLIRREGVSALARARARLQAGELPSSELFTGAALIFGGALLMAPGFLSDALGLACLLPSARRLLLGGLSWLGLKATVASQASAYHPHSRPDRPEQSASHDAGEPTTIEGEFISRDDPRHRR
ncbi:FxsA family protein [Vreelandella malpeensis]|uniref:FxsA family protein n=1 Tax=Vreelandella malpeensis TaxID=1172368 RepID=A0ABS8DUU9_9GAMM|nr:FxsA family protein [Halomonas malpeensis]MCB8890016.1 FxsA family protein [Halomonas malpeensis]